MITIFVGDCTEYLATLARTYSISSTLISFDNFKVRLNDGYYYTSIADLPTIKDFIQILNQADTIIYSPPETWSDTKNNHSYLQHWTEFYCIFFQNKKEVIGLDLIKTPDNKPSILELLDHRKTNSPQLWIAGCSISNGDGVKENERYGQLLAEKINKEVSFLTRGGTSIDWACDQILRSDIKEDDIVVWGLTSKERFTFSLDNQIRHVCTSYYKKFPEFNNIVNVNLLGHDENNTFHYVRKVYEVINICKKLNVKLILAGLLTTDPLYKYFLGINEFYQFCCINGVEFEDYVLDFGNDGIHPGPLTHRWYADQLAEIILK